MLTFRQLRYFDQLGRLRHFGKAASACAVTQPALSQQLKELEAELGLKLIERGPRRVTLTPEGREVAERAARILAEMRDLADYAVQRRGTLQGTLRLGVIPSIAPYVLPPLLATLRSDHPALDLRLRESQTERLVADLAQGELDLLLLALPVNRQEIETEVLFRDRFFLAVNAGADDGPAEVATVADVRRGRLLLLEEGHCLREQALNYCRIEPGEMRNELDASSLTTIIEMVAGGLGMTLLPQICAAIEVRDERIRLVPFAEPQPYRQVALAWRKSSPRRADFTLIGETVRAAMKDVVETA